MCDLSLCLGEGARWTARKYYSVILAEAENSGARKMKRCSALFENKNTVEWRVKAMKHYHDVGKRKKRLSGALAGALILSSPLTAFASGNAVETGLRNMYETTMTYVAEEAQTKSYDSSSEKIRQLGENEKIIRLEANMARGYAGYSPVLKKGESFAVTKISLKKGEQITVWVEIKSGSGPVDIGLIKGGTVRYVAVEKSGNHTFEIDTDGRYDVYVKNQNGGEVKLEFGYHY